MLLFIEEKTTIILKMVNELYQVNIGFVHDPISIGKDEAAGQMFSP